MNQTTRAPLLVHIGYHKTATSFLQSKVFTDRRLFSQPWGAQSPQALEWFVLSHPQRFSPKAARADFEKTCGPENATVPVISHEALSGQPNGGRYYADRVVERLHRTFPEARIIIGIREQKQLLTSLYYQHVRKGGTFSVEEFIVRDQTRLGFRPRIWLPHFEYDLMLAMYRKYWKTEDILVLPQEMLHSDPATYLKRLMDFSGLPVVDIPTDGSVNARSSNVVMRAERFFNRFIKAPNPRPERYRDYPFVYRAKNRVLQGLEAIGPIRRAGVAEDKRIKAYISNTVGDYYDEPNRRLAEMVDFNLQEMRYFQ